MTEIAIVLGIFTVVFGTDYLFYRSNLHSYDYVSRRTFALFIGGQIAIAYWFWPYLKPYYNNFATELIFIGTIFVVLLGFSAALSKEKLLVCHTSSRTERCLTPGYVLVKGSEVMFQQMTYQVIALLFVLYLGQHLLTYIAYILTLSLLHVIIILSMNRDAAVRLTFGMAVMAAPIMYVYTELQLFWPAVYVHAILYIFLWLTFANWDNDNLVSTKNTFHV